MFGAGIPESGMDYIEVQVVSLRNRLDGDGAGIFLEKQKDVSYRFRESIKLEEGMDRLQ